MSMLIIDGVKYKLWTPKDEEKEFHPMVKEFSKGIFGEDSIYFDIKHKLTSKSGIAAIPDAYVITLSKPYEWCIVENELASHPVYSHIVPQVSKFVDSIEELETQRDIRDILNNEIEQDIVLKAYIAKKTGKDPYRFLSELLSSSPKIALIIDEVTPEVDKASKSLKKLANTEIIEFKTFVREDAPNIHAHLFEPLYAIEKVPEKVRKEVEGRFTEAYHLEHTETNIISVYDKIKQAMLSLDSNIRINPQKYYISLRKDRNFAYILKPRKKKMHIIIMLPYETGSSIIKKHKLAQLSQGIQTFYNGACFQVTIENEDNLQEIIKTLEEAYKQQRE